MNKIINNKGYGILLNTFVKDELEILKETLTVKPNVLQDYDFGQIEPFPVYRLSNKYIYVPKFYGLEKYGKPDQIKEKEGQYISFIFNGELKDHQIEFCNTLLKEIKEKGSCIASSDTGSGKCSRFDTPHIMFDGSIKMVQDIQIGDLLMGDDSTPRKVLDLGRGEDVMYEIIPKSGETYTFNSEHMLSLKCTNIGIYYRNKKNNSGCKKRWCARWFDNIEIKIKSKNFETEQESIEYLEQFGENSKICDISIKEYLKLPKALKHVLKLYRVPVEFPHREVPFDPYIIGLWIGDGHSYGTGITSQDSAVIVYLKTSLLKNYKNLYLSNHKSKYKYNICSNNGHNEFMNVLRSLNLLNNKHIPDIYKINSRQVRLELLAGLIDTDGHLDKNGGYEFTQKNEVTIDGVIYLARSLGFSANKAVKKTSWTYKGIKNYGTAFRTHIYGSIEEIPCKIPRKKSQPRQQIKDVLVTGFKVVEKPRDKYYGFTLDGNHRYLLGDFTVSHNTAMSLWLVSQLKKRTLILVHKTFLLDQWVERIKQFLPEASIGVIQQNKCELDKDIVIGMIQTIISKDYPRATFDSFGTMIGDETHHLAAKTFSQVLFKCKTFYSIGLSATPIRTDGLTKVLEWTLGSIIKNEISSEVEKPTIEFMEAKYSTVIVPKFNFKGLLNAPNMINQLIEDQTRNKQIIDKIISLNNEGRKILILSGRREHCKKMKEMLYLERPDITSGLYLGGMKHGELDETNKTMAIFATFQSTSEAYDNPSLDTLLMATGMGSIEQPIGRILRRKNKLYPYVVDVIDPEFFGGQARRRKQFYKKKGYKIVGEKVRSIKTLKDYEFVEE
jgi:superfamily II DNA or RNA helicase